MSARTDTVATTDTVWPDLNPDQADGQACVVCARHYLCHRVAHVPVGRSVTGSQVFACVGVCAASAVGGGR
ncbi:MAG TPA: hypothetical protein VH352_06835 [Pseudonocardiaceae bacterium]|nr:hypothetical protein [Pseudonocardiaceae bacterium]